MIHTILFCMFLAVAIPLAIWIGSIAWMAVGYIVVGIFAILAKLFTKES